MTASKEPKLKPPFRCWHCGRPDSWKPSQACWACRKKFARWDAMARRLRKPVKKGEREPGIRVVTTVIDR